MISSESPQAQNSSRPAWLQLPQETRTSWSGSWDRNEAREAIPAGLGAMAIAQRGAGWMQSEQRVMPSTQELPKTPKPALIPSSTAPNYRSFTVRKTLSLHSFLELGKLRHREAYTRTEVSQKPKSPDCQVTHITRWGPHTPQV